MGGFVTYGTNRSLLTGVGMLGGISVSPCDALLLDGGFLSTPKINSCSFPDGAGLAHVEVIPGLWQLLDVRDPACRTGTCARVKTMSCGSAPNTCFGFWGRCLAPACVRACFRATGLTLTLRGVKHPFRLHLPSESLVSWSVRGKLC